MPKSLKLYKNDPVAPAYLKGSIISLVQRESVLRAKRTAIFYTAVAVSSFVSIFPAIRYAVTEFSQSEFVSYASLVFSDTASISAHWKEFLFSLASSAPLLGTTVTLIVLSVFLSSVAGMIERFPRAFLNRQLTA